MEAPVATLKGALVWVLSLLGLIAKPRFVARYSDRNPAPVEITESDLVIVQSGGYRKWACLRCPCGCGDKISLSLAANRRPSWRVSADWLGRPTIEPSVWQQAGCYSHFWVRHGQVEWCPGTGRRDDGGRRI